MPEPTKIPPENMRLTLILLLSITLSACGIVYTLPTRQGNVLEQDKLEQLEIGMTREQVRFLMGTPLAASPFSDDRWDYLGYYKSPRGQTASRLVSLRFEDNRLIAMEGIERPSGAAGVAAEPDTVREDFQDFGETDDPREGDDAPIVIPEPIANPRQT
jgi:outer membrane protein assembly factor BamE